MAAAAAAEAVGGGGGARGNLRIRSLNLLTS